MTQHSSLSPERWARFDLGQQILQIGAEMQRALKYLHAERARSGARPRRASSLHELGHRLARIGLAAREEPDQVERVRRAQPHARGESFPGHGGRRG